MPDTTENILAGRSFPYSIEVSHTTRGNTWVVKVSGDEKDKVFQEVDELFNKLKEKYGQN